MFMQSPRVELQRFRPGDGCTEGCPAKKYFIENGGKYCSNGHKQEGYVLIEADEDDFGTQGRTTRRKRELRGKVYKTFSEKRGLELYLQCYQLVLWKQVRWLVEMGLGGKQVDSGGRELEQVVRDLWAVRLRNIKGLDDDDDRGVGFKSGPDEEEEDKSSGKDIGKRKRLKKIERRTGVPKLIETLGLCYLGMVLLKIPISIGQLQAWAEKDEILYLRVIRQIPKEMRSHLAAKYHAAFETRSPLTPGDLHKAILEMVVDFKRVSGLEFPSLNMPLLTFKHVVELGLPPEIYTSVRRLSKVLGLTFTYPNTMARQQLTAYPEIQIIALIVLATKLAHPFDNIKRVPEMVTDPNVLSIDWDNWKAIMAESPHIVFKKGEEINVVATDALEMSDEKVDAYLDWYQRVWVDDRDAKMTPLLLSHFPISPPPPNDPPISILELEASAMTRLKAVQSSLTINSPVSPTEGELYATIYRYGEFYRYYRTVEELPVKARPFYEMSAKTAGITLEMLVRAAFLMEYKVQGLAIKERRRKAREERNRVEVEMEYGDIMIEGE